MEKEKIIKFSGKAFNPQLGEFEEVEVYGKFKDIIIRILPELRIELGKFLEFEDNRGSYVEDAYLKNFLNYLEENYGKEKES
jgi:hypothetical protein